MAEAPQVVTPASQAAPQAKPQGQPNATQPPEAGATSSTPAPPEEFEVTIRGQKQKWSKDQLIARAQRYEDSDRQYQEAARIRKEEQARQTRLRDDPFGYLKETAGMDDSALIQRAQELVYQQYQREQMSPEQRQIAEERQKREALEQKLQQRDERDRNAVLQQHTERATQHYLDTFQKALSSVGMKIDQSNPLVGMATAEMARLETINAENGFSLPAEELANQVRGNYVAGAQMLYGGLEGNALLDALDKDIPGFWRKVSSAVVARYTGGAPAQAPIAQRGQGGRFASQSPEEPKAMSRDEWRKSFGK